MADELIELIDADPDAFGRGASGGVTADGRPSGGTGTTRRRLIAGLVAVAAGGVTYAIFDDPPWADGGPERTYRDGLPATSALSDHLLLDISPSQVRATTLHTEALPAARNLLGSGAAGYFFGEPGATFDTGDGKDRWVGFYGMPKGAKEAPTVDNPTDTIAGAPAAIDIGDNRLASVAWGPVDGVMYTAAAANMSRNEVVSLLEQVRVRTSTVTVLNKAGLGTLQPLGRFADYWTIVNTIQRSQQNGVHLDGVVSVFYNTGASITSMPANRSVVPMASFVLGTATDPPTPLRVHGLPAIGFAKGKGAFNGLPATTVMWWEGGRLVQVSGEGTLDDVVKLADGAHVASAADWSAVLAVQ